MRLWAVVGALALLIAGAPVAQATEPFSLADGVSQPVFSYANAIRETVWVETGQDLDRDGVVDRVAADIVRPAEPAARGQRVPVIMDVSPYFQTAGRGNEHQLKTYAPDGTPQQFPLFYDNYFVPRGYAVVLVDVGGTSRSTGCFDDVASGLAVVNWLNGKARGYRTVDGQQRVDASWSTGAVAAVGKSQDGSTANGMAATGVAGLRTIVPIEAISSGYKVSNSNGAWFGPGDGTNPDFMFYNARAQVLCKPWEDEQAALAGTSGDYTPFWRQFDYAAHADKVRASVFAVQGLNDWVVRPEHFDAWWNALARNGVTRKVWLDQAGHVDPFDLQRGEFVDTLHRWLDRWLLGVHNGIEFTPVAHVEYAPDRWTDDAVWPPAGHMETVWANSGGSLGSGPAHGSVQFTDSHPEVPGTDWALGPSTPSDIRVAFQTPPLRNPLRLAGSSSVTVTVRSSRAAARIGVLLVDYGPATVRQTADFAPGIKNLTTRSCWGDSTSYDSACFLDTAADLATVDHQVIATSWADIGHWRSLVHGSPLTPGRAYTMTFSLGALDHITPAGHRIGLVIGGTDGNWFSAPTPHPTITVELSGTSVTLPVAR
ncbi:CocE/NonD family hydrolase [Kutzneria buriramensis]|uniref:X-Pro dipeptidyl-peptidase n=1 Tax=Kutzneria buriramensis TaxID=1045776 RepID=A0A3E0IAC8_9PSEU|nr:CocE/NonD family hydrolase [Kutzneria buriramensis]REH55630.1 X-Pro dipeptidyl-peptidase [Kutzneria buriramensis]